MLTLSKNTITRCNTLWCDSAIPSMISFNCSTWSPGSAALRFSTKCYSCCSPPILTRAWYFSVGNREKGLSLKKDFNNEATAWGSTYKLQSFYAYFEHNTYLSQCCLSWRPRWYKRLDSFCVLRSSSNSQYPLLVQPWTVLYSVCIREHIPHSSKKDIQFTKKGGKPSSLFDEK